MKLPKAGFCGEGGVKKKIEDCFKRFRYEVLKFWSVASELEGEYSEIKYVGVEFDSAKREKFEVSIKGILESNFPKPEIIEKIVKI